MGRLRGALSVLVMLVFNAHAGVDPSVLVNRNHRANAVDVCQAALPAYEGQVRKRPLAVQNEGTASAFVSCAFTTQGGFDGVRIYFAGFDGASHPVSCTGVATSTSGVSQYVVKSVQAPASSQGSLQWTASDFTGVNNWFSVSCSLSPGAAINDYQVSAVEDVGN